MEIERTWSKFRLNPSPAATLVVLQLSCLEILRTVSSKVHAATLVVLQLSCLESLRTVSSKVHAATLVVLQLSCLEILRTVSSKVHAATLVVLQLSCLETLRYCYHTWGPFKKYYKPPGPLLQLWWFCSCLAWKLLELLVLRFMLQLWWFCSCLAWKFLELLVLRFMLQPWWFCSCLGASSVLKFWKGIVTIHGDPSKSIINPRVPCCNSGGFAAVLLGNS